MDYLSKNLSVNLKKIRLGKKMSLDDVAEQTGVSKSMLGQIERGDSNPTIGTIGKIVSGLRVTVDDLICAPTHGTYLVNLSHSGSHGERTTEYIVVAKGVVTLKRGDDFYEVKEGDALRFESDKEHRYINNGKEILSFNTYFVFDQKY